MNASEAKQLTTKALSADGEIKGLLDLVYGRIKAAAVKGDNSITEPLSGIRQPISQLQREAVFTELRRQGYTVKFHEGDYRDPREHSYHSVSW